MNVSSIHFPSAIKSTNKKFHIKNHPLDWNKILILLSQSLMLIFIDM